MDKFFTDLFEYNHHYNPQVLMSFKANQGKTSERAEKIFNHVLYSHHTWNHRIIKKHNKYGIWEVRPLMDLNLIEDENFRLSSSILKEETLETKVPYINSSGESFINSIKDILFHIINHSTYHRGQIALDFRKTGIEPLVSDYIFFKRRK